MFRQILIMAMIFMPLKSYADAYEEGKISDLQIEGANLIMVWLDGPNDSADCSAREKYKDTHRNKSQNYFFGCSLSRVCSTLSVRLTVALII
jgi:hypothetical protein